MAGISVDRIVAVVAELDTGLTQIGSGFLLDTRRILTARHCTFDLATGRAAVKLRAIRASDGSSALLTMNVASSRLDLALLEVASDPPWGGAGPFEPLTFGWVDRNQSGVLYDCQAVGFPLWQRREAGNYRDLAELHGCIYTVEGREDNRLVMRDPVLNGVGWPPTEPTAEGQSAWSGLSGAAVFCGELLVGVVIEHHPRQGPSAVQIRPVQALILSGDPESALLGGALGVGVPDAFQRLTIAPTVPDPASADYQQEPSGMQGNVTFKEGPPQRRSRRYKRAVAAVVGAVVVGIAVTAAAVVLYHPNTEVKNQVGVGQNNGPAVGTGTINIYGQTGTPTSPLSPRVQITQQTGSYSEQGFINAIEERDTTIVALYLQVDKKATTMHENASALLFGFQGVSDNGDPIALLKTFQAAGWKVNDDLQDGFLAHKLTNGYAPMMLPPESAPKSYTGGYEGGVFVGSLLSWIVQRSLYAGPTDEDIHVLNWLISQGSDCSLSVHVMEFNTWMKDDSPYQTLYPMMKKCGK